MDARFDGTIGGRQALCVSQSAGGTLLCRGALNRAAGELLTQNGFYHASGAEHEVLAANNELRDLPSVNDVEGREAVIAMFKVALAS